jgi:hypothetical protein
MKRRKFFKAAGLTSAGAIIAPQLLIKNELVSSSASGKANNISINAVLYVSSDGKWKSVGEIKELKIESTGKSLLENL